MNLKFFGLTLLFVHMFAPLATVQTYEQITGPSGNTLEYIIPENTVLPETFVFPTKMLGPHEQRIRNCYDSNEIYSEILTGYEQYLPCWSNADKIHTFFDKGRPLRINLTCPDNLPKKFCADDTTEVLSYVSRNSRVKSESHLDYFPTSDLQKLSERFINLQRIELVNHKIGSLKGLETLANLRYLELSVTYIEDWSSIELLQQIETLNLACSNITDNDLVHIAKLSSIKTLVLDGTNIKDVSSLSTMKSLQNLLVKVTNIENLEELSSLESLKLNWVSFHPEWSRPYLERENHDPIRFVEGYSIHGNGIGVIDNIYPSKNCTEMVVRYGRVW